MRVTVTKNSDCLSLNCNNNDLCGLSTVGNGGYCSLDTDCNTLNCNTSTNLCSPGDIGSACAGDVDCISNSCGDTNTCISSDLAEDGEACSENADCNSGFCESNNLCASPDDQLLAVGKTLLVLLLMGTPSALEKIIMGNSEMVPLMIITLLLLWWIQMELNYLISPN